MIFQDLINNEHSSVAMILNTFFIGKIFHRYGEKTLRDHELPPALYPGGVYGRQQGDAP